MTKRCIRGFTLVELLVSMALLVVIVMIIGMFFQRASVAWDTGARKAEVLLTGRAVADFMAQELAMAMPATNSWNVPTGGNSASFLMLGDATATLRATQTVHYAFNAGAVTRNETNMCDGIYSLSFEPENIPGDPNPFPVWVDVVVTVSNSFGYGVFQSRATFPNRGREG